MGAPRSRPSLDTLDDFFDEESHERFTPPGSDEELAERRTTPPPGDYDPNALSSPEPSPFRPAQAPRPVRTPPISPAAFLSVAVPPSELRAMPIDSRMAYVLGLADGVTFADVVDACSFPASETARIVADLVELGALQLVEPRRRG